MKYRNMGKWGLKLSEIALGSWMTALNSDAERDIAKETVKLAIDNGVNFFDCADCYSGGAAERFLGSLLKDYPRSSFVVSSKVFFGSGPGANDWGLNRKHIFSQVDKSLKNLGMDYIDIYYCHRFDTTTPLEETLEALSDLVRQGKILYYGVSEEWSGTRITEAMKIIKEEHLRPMCVIQPQYNMADRYIEHDIMGVCEKYGIGITPFSPLAQGLLTGKYRLNQPIPEGSRATHQWDKQINKLLTEDNLTKVEKLTKVADELGVGLSVLALAWILRKEIVSSVITGASKPAQLEQNIKASGFNIPSDALDEIEKILSFKPFERHVG